MRARSNFMLDAGISTCECNALLAFRMRVSMSAMGSVCAIVPPYQLDLVTPGITPWCANSRRQMRHRPNLRKYPRGLPHLLQRWYARLENFAGRFAFAIIDFFAIP